MVTTSEVYNKAERDFVSLVNIQRLRKSSIYNIE